MQKIERLVAITLLLQARGKMTAQHLAELLGVSIRTIYRDMDALSLAHVPVSMDYGPGGGYYLPDDYRFESAVFTREEAISLMLGVAMAGNYSLFADDDDLHRALLKLEAALPEEYRADVRAARERILFDTTAWYRRPTTTAFLETIRSALWGSRQLHILYPCDNAAGSQWLRVDPYGLVYKGISRRHVRTGIWYLVAFCHACQSFNAFRVSYIENVHVRDEAVVVQPDFDLHTYWDSARGQLEDALPPFSLTLRIAPTLQTKLRGDYTLLREEADGKLVVCVNADSPEAAVSFALSLGADAAVISPSKVRDAVAATARSIAEMYRA
jgi:predicted DNA-binding transcriptional regulator YafY